MIDQFLVATQQIVFKMWNLIIVNEFEKHVKKFIYKSISVGSVCRKNLEIVK